MEIERKFKVKYIPNKIEECEKEEIEQGYGIKIDFGHESVEMLE